MIIKRQTPVSQQVVLILEKRIRDGNYRAGERLPAENDLSTELGVSRASLRTALAKLETAGLIIRKHGDGTYVAQTPPDSEGLIGAIWQFDHLIRITGREPSVRALSVNQRPASEEESRKLRIEPGAPVVITMRLFSADDFPVIITEDVFPGHLFPVPIEQVNFNRYIQEILNENSGNELAYSNAKIDAVLADAKIHELLKITVGSPVLRLKEVFFNRREDRPIAYTVTYLNTREIELYQIRPWY
jgi:GntR family transcriptional regulator